MPKSRENKLRSDYNNKLLNEGKPASSFSQLTYLLHLITALNSNDNLQSAFLNYRRGEGKPKTEVDSLDSLHVSLLDSIAAIFVQQHEVVAAAYTSDKVMVVETNPNPPTDDIDVLTESLPPHSQIFPLKLAALSNPDFKPPKDVQLNGIPHNLQIQAIGSNLWTNVLKNKWYYALM